MKRKKVKGRIFLVAVCLVLLGTSCQKKGPEPLSDTQFMLNTIVTISLYDKQDEMILQGAFDLCRYYENLFSKTIEGSDIYRINHSGGKPTVVSLQTVELLERGIAFGKMSNGMFDITAGSITDIWDFTSKEVKVPSPEEIKEAVIHVGRGEISIGKGENGGIITVADGIKIDVGAIAKGYIADQITCYLQEQGVKSAIVNLGGNLSLIGKKVDDTPFTVGIRDPLGEAGDYIASINEADISIVSSGSYERYFIEDGILYHHILDPYTGYPANSDLAGVTILCKDGIRADAMSTICFLAGKEKGLALAESQQDLEAFFVTKDGKISYTSGLQGQIELYKTEEEMK